MTELTDKQFIAQLRAYLQQNYGVGARAIVPLQRKDGVIDRDATLAMDVYQNFPKGK